ncbi:hypothetical protein AM305_10491 [Actinobacillus minor NM305]|uniref:Uncharacterized protein n=1 Tax=Actinobacillus minor NM305 TaxID=637911 RepID=C5S2J7_9PAST|nr:hypothetical protein AM305_10491 [Actinobacillus minor NM305]
MQITAHNQQTNNGLYQMALENVEANQKHFFLM